MRRRANIYNLLRNSSRNLMKFKISRISIMRSLTTDTTQEMFKSGIRNSNFHH